jgi:tetraprenyl-beta-curcumene synthase
MEQLENCIWLLKFFTKVLPEVKKQSEDIYKEDILIPSSKLSRIKDEKARNLDSDTHTPSKLRIKIKNERPQISESDTSASSKVNFLQNERSQSFLPDTWTLSRALWALRPDTGMEDRITFILSFCSLTKMLEACCSGSDIHSDGYSRRLYSILSSAVDLSKPVDLEQWQYLSSTGFKGETAVLLAKLCNQCREGLSMLPSYWEISPKIKKYMQLYIDLQTYKNYPKQIRNEFLSTWSDYYIKKYDGIYWWEFCAASDSLLGIIAMYYLASDTQISAEEIRLIDEACFPWLCCLESLLRSYNANRILLGNDVFDYTYYYDNLKAIEERLEYMASKAEASICRLKDKNYFSFIFKAMTGLYLSDPEADFGMHHLSTDRFLSKFSSVKPYYNICRLMRQFRIIQFEDADDLSPAKYQSAYPC